MEVNYYQILGLEASAQPQDIKKAFRAMAKKYHPDVNKAEDASERFRLAYIAYNVLSDPQKKAIYDGLYSSPTEGYSESDGFDEWTERARQRADYYAKSRYSEFQKRELGILEFIASQLTGVFVLVFIFLLGGILLLVGVYTAGLSLRNGFKPSATFAGLLAGSIGVGLLWWFLKLSKVLYQTTRDRFSNKQD